MALPTSDAFDGGTLDEKWTVIRDDAESADVDVSGVGQLVMTFASGTDAGYNRVLDEFEGPYIHQGVLASSADDDFDARLCCNSAFTASGSGGVEQRWGFAFHNVDTSFIAFMISRESGVIKARMITNSTTLNNTMNVTLSDFTSPYWLRVVRTWNSGSNSSYTMYTSTDGETWELRGGPTAKTVGSLKFGLFAGNSGGGSAVAWAPEFEFFEEAANDPFPPPVLGPVVPFASAVFI